MVPAAFWIAPSRAAARSLDKRRLREEIRGVPGSICKSQGSVTLTNGVRVAVSPSFVPAQSDPASGEYVFGYRIRISNESARRLRLVARRWVIVDGEGDRREVEGEGVIGQQPELAPGEAFTYSSFCQLTTFWGTMEGRYTMLAEDGKTVEVEIGRFYLAAAPAGSV
jgi:ApaG protein